MTAELERRRSLLRRNHPGDSSVASLPLNDVRSGECGAGCVRDRGRGNSRSPSFRGRRPWNPLLRGGAPNRGCGRVIPSSVILAKRGSPIEGEAVHRRYPRGTNGGIPAQSARMTAEFERRQSLLRWNHRGDCVVAKSVRLRFLLVSKAALAPLLLLFVRDPLRRVRGRGRGCRLRLPLNDVREWRCAANRAHKKRGGRKNGRRGKICIDKQRHTW